MTSLPGEGRALSQSFPVSLWQGWQLNPSSTNLSCFSHCVLHSLCLTNDLGLFPLRVCRMFSTVASSRIDQVSAGYRPTDNATDKWQHWPHNSSPHSLPMLFVTLLLYIFFIIVSWICCNFILSASSSNRLCTISKECLRGYAHNLSFVPPGQRCIEQGQHIWKGLLYNVLETQILQMKKGTQKEISSFVPFPY